MSTPMIAIAAMARNRVIGRGGKIPWRLPEDFKWFKRRTMGGTLVMGRKTFDSIGRPLPGRTSLVVTRDPAFRADGAQVIHDPAAFDPDSYPGEVFVCGGAEIYRQMLPRCAELLLTEVALEPEGDAFFPPFEEMFEPAELLLETPEFKVRRYVRMGGGGSNLRPGQAGPRSSR